jgi:hypothetical protein
VNIVGGFRGLPGSLSEKGEDEEDEDEEARNAALWTAREVWGGEEVDAAMAEFSFALLSTNDFADSILDDDDDVDDDDDDDDGEDDADAGIVGIGAVWWAAVATPPKRSRNGGSGGGGGTTPKLTKGRRSAGESPRAAQSAITLPPLTKYGRRYAVMCVGTLGICRLCCKPVDEREEEKEDLEEDLESDRSNIPFAMTSSSSTSSSSSLSKSSSLSLSP